MVYWLKTTWLADAIASCQRRMIEGRPIDDEQGDEDQMVAIECNCFLSMDPGLTQCLMKPEDSELVPRDHSYTRCNIWGEGRGLSVARKLAGLIVGELSLSVDHSSRVRTS